MRDEALTLARLNADVCHCCLLQSARHCHYGTLELVRVAIVGELTVLPVHCYVGSATLQSQQRTLRLELLQAVNKLWFVDEMCHCTISFVQVL